MTANKNGAPITEGAAENTQDDSSTTTALYYPLTWRKPEPSGFRGKGKRSARREAIERKRSKYGHAHTGLLAWLAATTVVWLLVEVAR